MPTQEHVRLSPIGIALAIGAAVIIALIVDVLTFALPMPPGLPR